jgi:hypothetical protein
MSIELHADVLGTTVYRAFLLGNRVARTRLHLFLLGITFIVVATPGISHPVFHTFIASVSTWQSIHLLLGGLFNLSQGLACHNRSS